MKSSSGTNEAMRQELARRVETTPVDGKFGTRLFAMSDKERDLVVRLLRGEAATPPGVVSVELLNSERRVNDDLRAENDRLRALAQDAPEPVLTGLQEDLILMSFHNEPVPQVAQGSFDTQYRDGLEEIGRYAKKLRKSRDLIGPAEYANDAKAMKVWQRALYHEGKTIEGLVKAALRGAQLHEPEKTVTSSVPSTVAQGPLQQEELAAIIRTGMSFGKPAFAIAGNILAALALSSTQEKSP